MEDILEILITYHEGDDFWRKAEYWTFSSIQQSATNKYVTNNKNINTIKLLQLLPSLTPDEEEIKDIIILNFLIYDIDTVNGYTLFSFILFYLSYKYNIPLITVLLIASNLCITAEHIISTVKPASWFPVWGFRYNSSIKLCILRYNPRVIRYGDLNLILDIPHIIKAINKIPYNLFKGLKQIYYPLLRHESVITLAIRRHFYTARRKEMDNMRAELSEIRKY